MKINLNMKNRERIVIAVKGGQPDQVPIDLSIGNQFNYMRGWRKLDGKRFFLDPEYVLKYQLEFIDTFQVEGVLSPVFGLAIEPSYFGAADIYIPHDTSPWVKGHLNTVERLADYLKSYKEPDPYTAGNFPLFCNGFAYFKNMLGDLIGAPMGMLGPFDTAACLCGSTNLFTWVKTEPNLIHDLLRKIVNFFKKNIEVRVELFKPDNNDFALYDDYSGFLSPKDYKEFAFPYIKEIFDFYTKEDSIRHFHCDAPMNHIMELLPEMGVNVLLSFDPKTDISEYKKRIGDRVTLKGNINPIKIMRFGTSEDVKREVKRQLAIAMKGGRYVMCTGGELGDGTPDENIKAMVEAVEEFGKY